ncbi:MAG: DNA polymerase [Acidiferrobacterales bacterium]
MYTYELVKAKDGRRFLSQSSEGWHDLFEWNSEPSFGPGEPVACLNLRGLMDGVVKENGWPFYDVGLLYEEDNLVRLSRSHLPELHLELKTLQDKINANLKAAAEAKLGKHLTMFDFVPLDLLREYFQVRGKVINGLVNKAQGDHTRVSRYRIHTLPLAQVLYSMERNGIHVDVEQVCRILDADVGPLDHERRFLRTMTSDMVFTRLSPVGVKTGRCRVEGGFNCMGIPHGLPREMITSRFEGGRIWSLDFNAIDYRCIVAAVGGRLAELYRGASDFHATTMTIARGSYDPALREIFKKVTYVYLYGGSDRTLAQATGLTQEGLEQILKQLAFLQPVAEFREKLWKQGTKDGYVVVRGTQVPVEKDDHEGKVLGLFAQGFASEVFSEALIELHRCWDKKKLKSKMLFPVHDELVVDAHPDDIHRGPEIVNVMQYVANGMGGSFVVKLQEGKNYREASE